MRNVRIDVILRSASRKISTRFFTINRSPCVQRAPSHAQAPRPFSSLWQDTKPIMQQLFSDLWLRIDEER